MSISGPPHHHPPAHLVHASEAGRSPATGPSDTFVASARKLLVAALLLSACIYGLYFVLFTTVWIDAATMVGKVSNITMIGLSLVLAFLLSRRPPDRRVVFAFAMVFHFAMA